MAFLIRTIDFTAAGREIVRDRLVDQASLTVGRAAENDIHLPDLAVEQNHVRIDLLGDGTLTVAALGTLGFALDGRVVMDGAADYLRTNEDVKEFYLGMGGGERKSFKDVKSYKRRKRWLA